MMIKAVFLLLAASAHKRALFAVYPNFLGAYASTRSFKTRLFLRWV
jgi:hypothetical protein